MVYGSSAVTLEEREEYHRYILAKQYGIRPWELNEDGEKYPEEINSLIAFYNLEVISKNKSESERQSKGNVVDMFRNKVR